MRRRDKEITDRAEIDRIIGASRVCRLGMIDKNTPYVIPLNFGYDGRSVFIHCAPQGRKLDILRRNSRVCLEFDIPGELVRGEEPCEWGMRFQSVIAFGNARLVDDPEERRRGLSCIMAQYDGRAAAKDAPGGAGPRPVGEKSYVFPDAMVQRTAVIRVEIEEITGKRSPAGDEGSQPGGVERSLQK